MLKSDSESPQALPKVFATRFSAIGILRKPPRHTQSPPRRFRSGVVFLIGYTRARTYSTPVHTRTPTHAHTRIHVM